MPANTDLRNPARTARPPPPGPVREFAGHRRWPPTQQAYPSPERAGHASALYGLARVFDRHRFWIFTAWLVVAVALVGVSHRLGDNTSDH